MRGVDLQVDGLTVDALVATSYPRCFVLDLTLDVRKVCESSIRDVDELSPF